MITAVTTFITPRGNTSKAILLGLPTNLRLSNVVRLMIAGDSVTAQNSGARKKKRFAALLTQRNVEDAAKAVGIGTATLLRWMKDPGSDAAHRAAKREVMAVHKTPESAVL